MRRSISRERVSALHDAGASVTQIAVELGCSKGAVSKILKSMRGPKSNYTAVAITDARLLHLLQAVYEHLWKLKEQGFPGVPEKLLLDRLKMLVAVVRGE